MEEKIMKKKYVVTYYCADTDRVLTHTCINLNELELFRSYLSRHTGLDELNALEFTLVKVGAVMTVYDIRKL
ncbi:MAG: hypothetical protein J6R06_06510 [Bacteroidales bacterium]|nr:hypothetical protein [Bacteroidales bacterium]